MIAVGGGISGVNIAKIIPQELNNVSLTIYEKNPELGGTWYENRLVPVFDDLFEPRLMGWPGIRASNATFHRIAIRSAASSFRNRLLKS